MTPVLLTHDRPRSSTRRAIWAMMFVGLAAAALAWAAVQELSGLNLLDHAHQVSIADVNQWERGINKANQLHLITLLAAAIAFLGWLWRIVENTPRLGGGRPDSTPRMAIVWWFVPIASLFKPYSIVADLWRRLAASPAESGKSIIRAWWILWVVGALVDDVILLLPAPTSLADARADVIADAAAIALQAIAGVLLVLIIRETERRSVARLDILSGPDPEAVHVLYPLPPRPVPPSALWPEPVAGY